ncbi:MAG TPA: hypothetical protein VML54_02390 [Candidatus Limnocylindrales bacterium]|nr:hypothetical protein [Candidatus Limnocylindrales bacterium]
MLDRAFQSGAVDPEVREALEGFEGRIVRYVDQSAIETRRQIEASAAETRQYVDQSVGQVRQDFDQFRTQIRRDFDQIGTQIRQDVDRRVVEMRRHFDVVAESLRADIRAMPEATGGGYASQAEMTALSRRTSRLEGRMDNLEKARRRRKR